MTTHWSKTSVRELVLPTKNWNPSRELRSSIRYIDVSSVSRETLSIISADEIPAALAPSRARKKIKTNDIIFATIRPTLKRVAQVPSELNNEIASTAFCILRPNITKVDDGFLFFTVSSDNFVAAVAELETGASYPAVRDIDILDQEILIPELSEQKILSSVLNLVRNGLLLQSKILKVLDQLKHATMHKLFTCGLRGEAQKETEIGLVPESWEIVPFSDIRQWLQYGTSIRCTERQLRYPVLRIPNIETGNILMEPLKYCDLDEAIASRYVLKNGDMLFIRTNGVVERLGSCAVYEGEPKSALFASYLIRARLKCGVLPRFVAFYFGSEIGSNLVKDRATPAADGKYNLNTGIIDSFPVPVPPTKKEQQEIVDILDAIDRKIDLHRRKKALLEELFKSLLHKLMTGEIRVDELDLSALEALQQPGGIA